jgi:hypothetical protein
MIHTGVGIHGTASNQASFDQFVGITTHDLTVFAGAWFSLISVDDQVTRTGNRVEKKRRVG